MRRVMRELAELKKNPPEGIRVQTNEEDMTDVTGIIQGPGEWCPSYAMHTADKSTVPLYREYAIRRGIL